ncbi:MAG: hypothetical protein AAFN07_02205 [Pseudomonadota bacterium]
MSIKRKGIVATATVVLATTLSTSVWAGAQVGQVDACAGVSEVLIGLDNDNVSNPLIQPIAPPPNQSLNNADVLLGEDGCDVLIGLQGNDVLTGGTGHDIMIGGTEQFDPEGFGNRDVMIGGEGSDINIWAPGDGSDAFLGGPGSRDAMVFGLIDRDGNNVPTLTPVTGIFSETGVPTANVTGSPGFCRLEDVRDSDLGFDYLVRFFVRSTGNLAVTIRLKDVEQVFCTSEAGGSITFANLRKRYAQFVEIAPGEVKRKNNVVSQIIR